MSTVLFHERYLLLPCVFEKDVKESTEFIHLCLLCNGMNCVQSNLYEENKAELSLGYPGLFSSLVHHCRPSSDECESYDFQLDFVFNISKKKYVLLVFLLFCLIETLLERVNPQIHLPIESIYHTLRPLFNCGDPFNTTNRQWSVS